MAYKCFCGAAADEAVLEREYKTSEVYWKLRLSDNFLFYPRLTHTKYVALQDIKRAFIRVETTLTRVCCGPAAFNTYQLILCRDAEEFAAIELDSETKADRILAAIAQKGIPTGVPAAS